MSPLPVDNVARWQRLLNTRDRFRDDVALYLEAEDDAADADQDPCSNHRRWERVDPVAIREPESHAQPV